MCKKFYLFSFVLFLTLSGISSAADPNAFVPATGTPVPVIDGVKEDTWSASEEYPILYNVANDEPDSDTDLSCSWQALWDSEYFYLFVDVVDEDLQNDSGESWQDDSVEIYFDIGNEKAGTYGADDYQYRAAWNTEAPEIQEYHHGSRSLPGVEFFISETDVGYTLEIKFPWDSLVVESSIATGDLLGFGVKVNDDDGGGDRDSQLAWQPNSGDAWQYPYQFGTVELVAGIKATNPYPRNGAEGVLDAWMQWTAGRNAQSNNVYFGTNPTPGGNEFIVNQVETQYIHAAGLEPMTTYFWRIDGVEADGTKQTGDIWSFTSAPLTANNPDPENGARWIDLNADLSWSPGINAQTHDVYIGTDEDAVINADTSSEEFKGNQSETTFEPGRLQAKTTYYWRIDEVESDGITKHKGQIWRFTALGAGAGVKAEYFDNLDLAGEPIFTRVDDVIDFDWGQESPDPLLDVDDFSARWTAELEVPATDTYTFNTIRDILDGVRLWVDGKLIIENWPGDDTDLDDRADIELYAGSTLIVLEYYDDWGGSMIHLYWESPSIERQIIPKGVLMLPLRATNADPPNGATEIKITPTLKWTAGDGADQHDVYFGTNYDEVAEADFTTPGVYRGWQNRDNNTYIPSESPLDWNTTYYWRIDEYNTDKTITEGNVWSFTTGNYHLIDDFEDYNDYTPNEVWNTWVDGYDVPTNGSSAGYPDPDFLFGEHYLEEVIVHSGNWSMPLFYDNSVGLSEVTRTLTSVLRNWTRNDVATLTMFYYGDPNNAPEPMYVAVDNAVVTNDDANAALVTEWTRWDIPLSEFADQGVNLGNVSSMSIGFGNRANRTIGGSGHVFFDDIRLYRP